jgi:hypothetical protein
MRGWSQALVAKWAMLLVSLACVCVAGWMVLDVWRGPTPAKIDSHSTAPPVGFGRPQRVREANPTGARAPTDQR